MDTCAISVIVPVYNVENYLTECVSSILNQTFLDFECILVDDGSTDASGALCDVLSQKDERIRVIHQKNGGLSAARNTGLDAAKGRYISFVDSDDVVGAHFLEVLYSGIQKERTKISVCRYSRFQDGTTYGGGSWTEHTTVWDFEKAASELSESGMDERAAFVTVMWNKLYDRELFRTLRFQEGKLHEDEFLIHHLLLNARKLCICDAVQYFYRQRRSSIMGSEQKLDLRHLQAFDAYEERCRLFRGDASPALYRKTVTRYFEIMILYAFQYQLPPKAFRQLRQRYVRELLKYGRWVNGKRYFLFALSPAMYRRRYWK